MRSRKYLAALLAALCLALTACQSIRVTGPAPTLIPGEPERKSQNEPMRAFTRTVGLYYPQSDDLSLRRRTSEIVCEEGMWLPEVLVRSLLEPVDEPGLVTPFGGNAELRSIASCNEMLVVELDFDEHLESKLLHASVLALTRTLTQEAGAESVLLLRDGARVRLRGALSNPVKGEVSLREDLWEAQTVFLEKGFVTGELSQHFESGKSRQILFYPDRTGAYILCRETELPEARINASSLRQLLEEVPEVGMESLAQRFSLTLEDCERAALGDASQGLRVRMSAPDDLLSDKRALRQLRALTFLNIRANDAGLEAVAIELNGQSLQELLEDDGAWYEGESVREQFGEEITLYFLSRDRQSLTPVRRTVSFSDSISPEAWMRELLKGPDAYDPAGLLPVFPEGIGPEDLLRVETDGVNAVLDFSESLEAAYPVSDETMERMMVYAIVNTLTEDVWIQRVLLQVEGRQVDSLGGQLYLGTPLMRNPGLIRREDEKG